MRINRTPQAPVDAATDRFYRSLAAQINGITEGSITALHTARTSAPTTGDWKQGDFVHNSATAELGAASSKYVIDGWRCVASGTPGTWVQRRSLTGN